MDGCAVSTHLTLRDFVRKRSEFLAQFIDPRRGVGECVARRGDVRLNLFCIEDEHSVSEGSNTYTDRAPALPYAFLSVEFSSSRLAFVVPPSVSVYSPERRYR